MSGAMQFSRGWTSVVVPAAMLTEYGACRAGLRKTPPPQRLDEVHHYYGTRRTSLGHQHWVYTSLGRSAPLPHTSYQD
eukprot:scaffold91223_cov69-Phaeocystis_antarctica.AAC.6